MPIFAFSEKVQEVIDTVFLLCKRTTERATARSQTFNSVVIADPDLESRSIFFILNFFDFFLELSEIRGGRGKIGTAEYPELPQR